MNSFSTINGSFRNQHVTPRAGRRPLGNCLALEALEGRAMMAGDAQLDAAPEAVALLADTRDQLVARFHCGFGSWCGEGIDNGAKSFSPRLELPQIVDFTQTPIELGWFHRDIEFNNSMTFYRHDLPDTLIPQGGTPYWSLEAPDGNAMLDDTWYRLPSGDFVSKHESADFNADGKAEFFLYKYANMHDYGPPQGSVWICGGFYSRVSHSAISDWNDNGPVVETYVPPVRLPYSPPIFVIDVLDDPPVNEPPVSDPPAANPIAQAYASPDLWQKVWGDTDSGTNGSPSDVPQTSPRDEVADAPAVADPVADTREDGWQDEVFAEEPSDTTEPADDTLAEAVVDELVDADFIPSFDSDYVEEV